MSTSHVDGPGLWRAAWEQLEVPGGKEAADSRRWESPTATRYDERNPNEVCSPRQGCVPKMANGLSEASLSFGQLTVREKVHVPVSPSASLSLPVTV
jgi:hypothetical protein